MSANRVSNIQRLFPTVGQCATVRFNHISRSRFGTIPFTLPLVPYCLYGILVFLASVHRGIPLDNTFDLIVEVLNYTNSMSRIE